MKTFMARYFLVASFIAFLMGCILQNASQDGSFLMLAAIFFVCVAIYAKTDKR